MIPIDKVLGNVFTFAPAGGGEYTIAVDMLTTWALGRVDVIGINIDPDQAEIFARENSVEPHRLARIGWRELNEPILLIEMGDGTHTLVDGSHRYVVAGRLGLKALPGRLIARPFWQAFRVSGMPTLGRKILQTMYSGID